MASPDGGTSTYVYDDAGNITQKTDPRGIVTTYQYDALNPLVAQSYPANSTLNVVYTYDQTANGNLGIGHLTSLQDASGTTTFTYDNRGQRIAQNKTLNLAGLAFSSAETFSYDSAGRLTQHGYPDSVAVNYTRNNAGQVTAVSLNLNGQTLPIASNIAYAAFGPVTQLTWGNSLTLNRTYGQDYQLTAQTIGSWQFQYAFDAAGNLSNQQSNLWGSVQYQYDALDRLTQEKTSSTQKDYTLDATGNRTQRTTSDLASGTVTETQPATVAADSNRLATLDNLTLPYDAAGNLQQHTTGLRYTYDESGRMNAVYQAGAQRVAVYSYNALGQRSLKLTYDPASGALQTGSTFYYGPSGELIGQTDYSGTTGQRLMTRYWVWLDNLPLAQVELKYTQGALSGGQILYLHPDHLNAPRIATNQQAVVWTWNSDAFGAALPNEDVDGDGVATHIPLRFPGQYYDAQTQLSYNYFRDYDANFGRYVQSDPIGLRAGNNTYIYVDSNPTNRSDAFGLDPWWGGASFNKPLYRAVQQGELNDLIQNGAWRNPMGIETKYFSETVEGAVCYAKQAYKAWPQEGPYSFIRTSIPSELVTPEMTVPVDGGIPAVVVPTEMLPELAPPEIIIEIPFL